MEEKNDIIKLDLKDKKILYELDINARQTASQIAKKVRLSKDTVNYRIKRLEKLRVIKGYYTIFDNSKLGYLSFRVYIKYFETTIEKETKIIDFLVKNKKVGWVAKKEGYHDLAFLVWCKDIYEFNDFWKNFLRKFRSYFNEEYISLWAKLYHYRRAYLLDLKQDNSETEIMGGSKKIEKLDEIDFKILRLIAKNARISLVELSDKLKLTERAIAYRIKILEKKKIILGYRALLDINKLGFEYYKIDLKLKDASKISTLMEISRTNPNIIYTNEMVGGTSDFEFDVQIKNKQELFKLLSSLKEKLKEAIRSYEISTTTQEYKLLYLPVETEPNLKQVGYKRK